jgi:hypothetical protein
MPQQQLPALKRALKVVTEEMRQAVLNVICGSHWMGKIPERAKITGRAAYRQFARNDDLMLSRTSVLGR